MKRCANCKHWRYQKINFPETECLLLSKREMDKVVQPKIDHETLKQGRAVIVHHQVGVSTGANYVCNEHEFK